MSRPPHASERDADAHDHVDARLAAACADAETQLARLEAEYRELVADGDTIQEDRDTTRQLLEEARASVAGARRALERHRSGRYGRCERCDTEIPAERLEALPDVTVCVDCHGRA